LETAERSMATNGRRASSDSQMQMRAWTREDGVDLVRIGAENLVDDLPVP
jgi:hypothetical protein